MQKKASPVKSSGESGGASARKSRKTLANEAEAKGAEDEWTVAEAGAADSRSSASAATSSDDDAGSATGAAGAEDYEAALEGRDDPRSAEVVDQPPTWLGSLLDRIDALEKSKPTASPAAGLAGSVAAGPPEDDDVIEDFTHRQQGFVQFPLNP